mgnify:CR=1 FL=1
MSFHKFISKKEAKKDFHSFFNFNPTIPSNTLDTLELSETLIIFIDILTYIADLLLECMYNWISNKYKILYKRLKGVYFESTPDTRSLMALSFGV